MKSDSLPVYYNNEFCYQIELHYSFDALYTAIQTLGIEQKRLCIVTDSIVDNLYGMEVQQLLEQNGCTFVKRFVFPSGEEHKTLEVIEQLYEFLILHQFDRSDVLIALGGGVTGDMTGYAAATYLRGIRFIQIPTTLLSMVDSSIGGKTGVDFKGYKNMVGAFYQPSLVYVNTSVLTTLDKRQRASGMGEILKHGLIKDIAYYEWLQNNKSEILNLEAKTVKEMIYRSQCIKKEVVEADPKEKGERALLNFGHTIGHAIEKSLNFSLLHGECVALGMVAAGFISMKKGHISNEELQTMEEILRSYELPIRFSELNNEMVLDNCLHDKKKDGKKLRFILLKELGLAYITTDVSYEEMNQAINYLKEGYFV